MRQNQKILDALKAHPSAKLVIMNLGGLKEPEEEKDFGEWDLFEIEARKEFPEAMIYMGDSLSEQLRALRYPECAVRKSDLSPLTAAKIINASFHLISGRYHGEILAKVFGVPFDSAIFSYKVEAERSSNFDKNNAIDQINYLKAFLENDGAAVSLPTEWDQDQRNSSIVKINGQYPEFSIPFLQAFSDSALYKARVFGKYFLDQLSRK